MRFYYIFSIKNELLKESMERPANIYKILENIYMNYEDKSEMIFSKILNEIDIENINILIKEINNENMNYMCFKNVHTINDFFKQENSKIILKKHYMLLKSNSDYPSFLKDVKRIPNLFICDFINEDYFFIQQIEGCIVKK